MYKSTPRLLPYYDEALKFATRTICKAMEVRKLNKTTTEDALVPINRGDFANKFDGIRTIFGATRGSAGLQ
jgi:hypothetical protein